MTNKQITTKCVECNAPKVLGSLFCERHLKAEYERYFRDAEHNHRFVLVDCARSLVCECGEVQP